MLTDSIVASMIPGMGSSSVVEEVGDDGGDPSAVSALDDGMGSIGSGASGAAGTSGIFELEGRRGRLADVAGPDLDVTPGLEQRARGAEAGVPVTELLRLRGLGSRWEPDETNTFCNLCLRWRLNSSRGTPPRCCIALEACTGQGRSVANTCCRHQRDT